MESQIYVLKPAAMGKTEAQVFIGNALTAREPADARSTRWIPAQVGFTVLTAGVDVSRDRIECTISRWDKKAKPPRLARGWRRRVRRQKAADRRS